MDAHVVKNEQGIEVVRVYDGPVIKEQSATFVNEGLLADALLFLALQMDTPACTVQQCPDCNPARLAWWNGSNALSKDMRRSLHGLLKDASVATPLCPYEEVEE